MKIKIDRLNDACNFRATNEEGVSLLMDGSPEVGGEDLGFRPMQMLIAALGGCSSIDIVNILQKQRQDLHDIKVEIDAERADGANPSLFNSIKVHFILIGNIEKDKAQKAIELSMEKYCSVARILEKTALITYDFDIQPNYFA